MSAQWTSDFSKNTMISGADDMGASLVQTAKTPDGNFWVTWLLWEDGMNGHIKAQLVDPEGNCLLEEGGVYVSNQITASWTSNYSMGVAPNGDLIVCHSDSRKDPVDRHTFEPYVYRMDTEGNMLWGLDGVALPTLEMQGHRPKVGVTNEGTIIIGYNDIYDNNTKQQFQLMKLNEDGTLAWEQPMEMQGAFGAFYPCEEDDLYLSIIENGSIVLYRLDSLGDTVWRVVVEDRDPNTRTEIQPIPDGLGGVFIPYQRYINLSVFYTGVQRVSPEGETMMGLNGVDLCEEPAQHSAPGIAANPTRGEFVANWNMGYAGTDAYMAMKFDYYGDPIWDEPIEIEKQDLWGYASCNGTMLDDGSAIIVSGRYNSAVNMNINVMRLDPTGAIVWNNDISPDSFIDEPSTFFEDNEGVAFWCDNRIAKGPSPGGHVWGQNFDLTTGRGGRVAVEALQTLPATGIYADGESIKVNSPVAATAEIFSLNGAKVASVAVEKGSNTIAADLESGIYLVRVSSDKGSASAKVFVK